MIHGACLCAKIEFEAEEIPGMVFNCHCSRCRRAHGAAFSTQVILNGKSLKLVKGEELLKEYEFNGIIRAFCSHCGSRLLNYGTGASDYLSASLPAVTDGARFKPVGECFVPAKLPFVRLDESVPHFERLPG